MSRERFVSDNPYRLLSLPSESGYSVLRKKTDSAMRSIQVGILPEVPLDDLWEADFEGLTSRVRSLATDWSTLCLYRILWPFEEPSMKALIFCSELAPGVVRPITFQQSGFLDHWYMFLASGTSEPLRKALPLGIRLAYSQVFATFLAARLAHEESVPREKAQVAVDEACSRLIQYLGERAEETAESAWNTGGRSSSARLTGAIVNSTLPEQWKRKSLDAAEKRAEQLIYEIKSVKDMSETELEARVGDLEEFESAIGKADTKHHFKQLAQRGRDVLVVRMISAASRLIEAEQRDKAVEQLKLAYEKQPSPELSLKIKRLLQRLQDDVTNQKVRELTFNLAPVYRPPRLSTVTALGYTLCNWTRFKKDPVYEVATLCLSVFIPILPLRRFVVLRKDGTVRFVGKVPWSLGTYVHALTTCVTSLIVCWLLSGIAPSASVVATERPPVKVSPLQSLKVPTASMPLENNLVPHKTTSGLRWSAPTEERRSHRASVDDLVAGTAVPKSANSPLGNLENDLADLRRQVDELDRAIVMADKTIEARRKRLEDVRDVIEALNIDNPSPSDVEAYNQQVDEYERERAVLNAKIISRNKLLAESKVKVVRYNEIVGKVNSERGN